MDDLFDDSYVDEDEYYENKKNGNKSKSDDPRGGYQDDDSDDREDIGAFEERERDRSSSRKNDDPDDRELLGDNDVDNNSFGVSDWLFLLVVIAIGFIIVSSDIFVNQVLTHVPSAVEHGEPTMWGSLVQTISQVLIVMVAMFAKRNW